jgi:hypothetical protein
MTRFKVFVSYSHKDRRWLDSLCDHLGVLEQEGLIDVWADTRIGPGEDWRNTLDREMATARLALLLVSTPFLTSAFVRTEEVPRLFQQHESAGMTLYPLLVRHCLWEEVGWLSRMQIRPPNARPLASMRGAVRDACLANVAREVASIVRADSRTLLHRAHEISLPVDLLAKCLPGDLDILHQIAFARGQRISAELLGERFGVRRCAAAIASLERAGLIRSFINDRGKRFAVTELGRQVLAEKTPL